MSAPIAVLIADDHAMFGHSLAEALENAEGLHVRAVVRDGTEAVNQAVAHKPDVVLLDIDMPGMLCFDAARIIMSHCPKTAVVFVSAYTHDYYIEQALAVGAAGYVSKTEPLEKVIAAIRAAAAGEAYFSPDVQARIVVDEDGARLGQPAGTRLSRLTRRELHVLRYVARGLSNRQIAKELGLCVKTVDAHTYNMMKKLDIQQRVALALFAIREGLARA